MGGEQEKAEIEMDRGSARSEHIEPEAKMTERFARTKPVRSGPGKNKREILA